MVSKLGRRNRKKIPQTVITEEPTLIANCICCFCESVFQPQNVAGVYLERRCPSCGRLLNEDAYDLATKELFSDNDQISEMMSSLGEKEKSLAVWVQRLRWTIFRPIRCLFEKKLKIIRTETSSLGDKRTLLKKRIDAYALSRYYTGEWYQSTHIPLKRSVVAPYHINVYYGKDMEWRISCTDRYTSGIVAEFRVFQELLSHVKDQHSSIHDARILPNIYLPYEKQGSAKEKLWSQIDCLLLTRQAAFVIETKQRRTNIVALKPFENIWATCSYELFETYKHSDFNEAFNTNEWKNESFALNQNSVHAIAFSEVCSDYEYELIYEQVVYVGTNSFATDCYEFIDNVNVCSLNHIEKSFVDIIERQCESLDDSMTQDRLEELGAMLIEKYGDLNQKRGQLHAQRIMSIYEK